MSTLSLLEAKRDNLRKEMHEAPMNTLRTDANGHRWIGSNSMAYADRSSEWIAVCDEIDRIKKC